MCRLAIRLRVPRVETGNSERFEVFDVSCHDGHLGGLRDDGNECVVERCMLGDAVGGEDPRGWQIKRKYTVCERRQDVLTEPTAKDPAI